MEKRLREITEKYTSTEIMEKVSELREEIILKRYEINLLKKGFTKEETVIATQIPQSGDKVELDLQGAKKLHERIGYFQKEIKELWVRTNDFLSKWM